MPKINQSKFLFIPGAAKSGTTSLHEMLAQHFKICAVDGKEPHFFSRDDRYKLGLDYYHSLFKKNDNTIFFMDSSTSYLVSKKAKERIKKIYPESKFIILLRNPIKRIESHYNWLRSLNIESRSFEEVKNKITPFIEEKHLDGAYNNYFAFSEYGKSIKELTDIFDRDNILILSFEDLKSNPSEVLKKCNNFLNFSDDFQYEDLASNKTKEIINHKKSLFNFYKRLPKFIKSSKVLTPLKKKYRNAMKHEKIYRFSDEDKAFICDRLHDDFKIQSQLFPEIFKKWDINL